MNTRKKTSAMVESALITAIAVVFALAGIYIPFLTILLTFLLVPFTIIGAKNGLRYSILSLVVATFMLGGFMDPLRAIAFFVVAGLSSIVMGYMIGKKYSAGSTVIFGSIALVIAFMISFALMPKIIGYGPIEMLEEVFKQSREMYEGLIAMSGVETEMVEEMLTRMDQMESLYLLIFPASIILSSVVITYINYITSGIILRRIGFSVPKPRSFAYFRLPRNFMMGALVIVILTYLTSRFSLVKSDALNANIVYLFQIIFIVLGLSVVSFFLEKRGIGKVLRRVILVFILLNPIFSLVLFFVGLADAMMNIRKLEN